MCPKTMNEHGAAVPSLANLEPLEQLTLAVARLAAWRGDPRDRQDGKSPVRSWKGFSFKALRRLSDAGLVVDRPGARTLELTEEGCQAAEGLLSDLGVSAPEIPVRSMPDRNAAASTPTGVAKVA